MAREEKRPDREFSEYQEFIVSHLNYQTLPNKLNAQGEITWVKVRDIERTKWWDELKINLGFHDRASVARAIHPIELGGYKPCQVCGRQMSIYMVYPDVRTTKKLNETFPSLGIVHFGSEIYEIAAKIEVENGSEGLKKLAEIFDYSGIFLDPNDLASKLVSLERNLSPGVMSNAPDRLDGFHTYNACCRSTKDTGRHSTNLSRYSTDRRAYENWADGNWRGADRLMGKYKSSTERVKCKSCGVLAKMTADHVGPISLGFTHRMDFVPLCKECNSKKNNRMTFRDFAHLIRAEDSGEVVISWHSKAIWDDLKHKVKSDEDALAASKILRKNMHYVMCILAEINRSGHQDFLKQFLHPEFASFDYEFKDFDVATGNFSVQRVKVDNLNTQKQARRYIRISFESLAEYNMKENRKSAKWNDRKADEYLKGIIELLENNKSNQARQLLEELLVYLAGKLTTTLEFS